MPVYKLSQIYAISSLIPYLLSYCVCRPVCLSAALLPKAWLKAAAHTRSSFPPIFFKFLLLLVQQFFTPQSYESGGSM